MSIQAGANTKYLRVKMLTFLGQKQRDGSGKKSARGGDE